MVSLKSFVIFLLAGLSAAMPNRQGMSSNRREVSNSQVPTLVAREPIVFPRATAEKASEETPTTHPFEEWLKGIVNHNKASPGSHGKRALAEDLEIPDPPRDPHWAPSLFRRTPAPVIISRTEKVIDSLTLLNTRVKGLNTAVAEYPSGIRAAGSIQMAIQTVHSASLNTNDDSLLLPPLNAEESKKIVEYIKDNIVVNILASVKAMQEKAEEFKKAKLGPVVIVALKSLREDYDRPSMVLAGKIVKEDMDTAKGLLKTVDDAILEGIKGIEG